MVNIVLNTLTYKQLKRKIVDEASRGGLIYVKLDRPSGSAPKNVHWSESTAAATSGYWRTQFDPALVDWILLYYRPKKATYGTVWIGDFGGSKYVEKKGSAGQVITLLNVRGPLKVNETLIELVGRHGGRQPLYMHEGGQKGARRDVNSQNRAMQRSGHDQQAGSTANDLLKLLGAPGFAGSSRPTTKKHEVEARLGQGKFRADVLKLWGKACAVTGTTEVSAIRASHIVAWSESKKDRLNFFNGLPLIATLDALFDVGLISFDKNGRILISKRLPANEQLALGLHKDMRLSAKYLRPEHLSFLKRHRLRLN